jgi:pimeloyl-ACP methyl ester carboxylesterase
MKETMEIQRGSVKVLGRPVCYEWAGTGPPLVLVHGLLGGSFCWRFNLSQLARRFTTVALDLPGFGESEARNGTSGMEAQSIFLSSFLQELGLKQVNIVASSWGGGVAVLLAAQNPKAVLSLVLSAPVNPWSELGLERVRFFAGPLGSTLLRLAMPFSRPVHLKALQRMYGDPERIPPGTLEGYSEIMLRRGRAQNIVGTLRCWERDLEAMGEALTQVKAPALLIWGTRDGAVDLRSAEVLRRRLPNCELAIIEGAGHLPFEETPEEFNRLVMGFLEKIGSSADREIGPSEHPVIG